MPVSLVDATRIALSGSCPAGDAEELLRHLLANPLAIVDWRACDEAHSAVVQVLLAANVRLDGPPRGPVLSSLVTPAINAARRSS